MPDPRTTYTQFLERRRSELASLQARHRGMGRTLIGQDTLAGWLKAPADPATVQSRQQAVDELRSRVDLREELAVLAEEARRGVHAAGLAAWGEEPVRLREASFRTQVWI